MKPSSPTHQLLRLLAPGETVSGQALAEHLGVTRAAVWKQVAALRGLGLPIEARTGSGYRLPWPVELLDLPLIDAALDAGAGAPQAPLHLHWELDSTQDELARLLPHAPDLTVVLAEHQHQGRGRRSQSWLGAPGLSLSLSCLKHFGQGPGALSGLSVAMGVCAVQALQSLGVPGLGLKWPNDVMSASGKLAGILIEVGGEYDGPCVARVGLGLNLRLPSALAQAAGQPVTDLAGLYPGDPPGRNLVAARLIDHLRAGLLRFEQDGLAPFARAFAAMDWLRDRPVHLHGPQGLRSGTARGMDGRGALRVELDGRITAVHSNKVSVRAD